MEQKIFRWKNGEDIHEYRFTDGICDGFFSNGVEVHKQYKGRPLTEDWEKNLPEAGFKLVGTL